jgi:hypothetical protein
MNAVGNAAEIWQIVVDESQRPIAAMASALGLRLPRALPVAMTRSIGKPWSRRLRRRAASCSASSAETQTRSKPASWRRWQASTGPRSPAPRPELGVEVAPEVGRALFVEPLDVPAVHRPVGERVALGGGGAEGARPGAGVAEVEVEEDAVGVEGDHRAAMGEL